MYARTGGVLLGALLCVTGCCGTSSKVAATTLENAIAQAALAAHEGSGGSVEEITLEVNVVTTASLKGGGNVGAVALEGATSRSTGTKVTLKVNPAEVIARRGVEKLLEGQETSRYLFDASTQQLIQE